MKKKYVRERVAKRIFDIVLSSLFLSLLSPLFLLVAIILKLESLINPLYRGPVFYQETRISRGRKFQLFKFRTVNAHVLKVLKKGHDSITVYTAKRDKHKYLTPIGTVLAQIYFDELPQLFNVVKGEMSLVGPRPHIPSHYENDLKSGIVSAKYIKAGVMGLVQASKGNPALRNALARMATKHKTSNKTMIFIDRVYFQKYLRASSFEMLLYDIEIMFLCLRVVLKAQGI